MNSEKSDSRRNGSSVLSQPCSWCYCVPDSVTAWSCRASACFFLGHQSFDRLDVTVGAADAGANLKVSHEEADCYTRNEKPQARIIDSKYYRAEFPLKRLADVDDMASLHYKNFVKYDGHSGNILDCLPPAHLLDIVHFFLEIWTRIQH